MADINNERKNYWIQLIQLIKLIIIILTLFIDDKINWIYYNQTLINIVFNKAINNINILIKNSVSFAIIK